MGRLPNYRLRYRILLRMVDEVNQNKVSVSEIARENRASNNTIYNSINAIRRDFKSIKEYKDTKKSQNIASILD